MKYTPKKLNALVLAFLHFNRHPVKFEIKRTKIAFIKILYKINFRFLSLDPILLKASFRNIGVRYDFSIG